MYRAERTDLDTVLARAERTACASDIPERVVNKATAATRRRFREWQGRSLHAGEAARVSAYYDAVVRKSIVREPSARGALYRRVLQAVVADLRSAGLDDAAVLRELRCGWSGTVDAAVLDEFVSLLGGQPRLPLAG